MLPSKPKSGLSDSLDGKTTPSSQKVGKTGRTGSTKADSSCSPLQKSRSSPRSVELRPGVERRSPRCTITPDKQAQLGEVQEDLKKAKEQLASIEQEKARVLEELKDVKNLADEANEKLKEAVAAQKRAEESSEIEKFRADELEQAGIEAAQKREAGWADELESITKKHNLELEKIKGELEATIKAKITTLNRADDAMRIAEINAEKVEVLSGEVSRLKSLLDSKIESANSDKEEVIKKLGTEVDSLKHDLERAKQAEEKLVAMELMVESLNNEVNNARSVELDSLKLVDEWKKKSEFLESQLIGATRSVKSSLESLAFVTKQLEESKALLYDSEFETSALKEKVELLEDQLKSSSESHASLAEQLEEVNTLLLDAESKTNALRGKVESLEIEVSDARKAELCSNKLADEWREKAGFLEVQLAEANQHKETSSESLTSISKQLEESNSSLQDTLSENDGLKVKIGLLEIELKRYKEDLIASDQRLDVAQQEVIEMGKEVEYLKSEIEILEEEKLRALDSEKAAAIEKDKLLKELEMARQEDEKTKKAMEGLASALHEMSTEARETQETLLAKRVEHENANIQIEQLRSALSNTEENYKILLDEARDEIACLWKAIEKLETEAKDSQSEWSAKELLFVGAIKASEEELASFKAMKEDGEELASKLRQAESRASCANEVVEEAKAETSRLRERLLDRENELQSISQENAELRIRESASMKKVDELSALLVEATTKKPEGSVELSHREKEYDLLPNSKEIPVESINGNKDLKPNEDNGNGEDYKAAENGEDFSSEMEKKRESVDTGIGMTTESGNFYQASGVPSEASEDGSVSPTKQQQQKKKKPLLQKFGSILKKKSPHK